MKLLIITQVLDTEHPILGFFHQWVAEFAVHCEHVHVIALQVGHYDLPPHVTVHSLGKERGVGRLQYVRTFYRLIFSLRHEYDGVFVHMNQIYVLLGAPLWHLWGKRVGLWYMHGTVSLSLRLATGMVHHIFTGSKESFRIESQKVIITGHGIDVAHFRAVADLPRTIDLITVGRITPVKNLRALIDIVVLIRAVTPVTLTVVGSACSQIEQTYFNEVNEYAKTQGVSDAIIWYGGVTQADLPAVLQRARVFVTAAQNGSLDKAVLEAMAVGLPVVSMAPGTRSLPLESAKCKTPEECASKTLEYLTSSISFIPEYASYVVTEHSLTSLIPKILTTMVE